VFNAVDFLGGLYAGANGRGDTFREFMSDFFPSGYPRLGDCYDVFRCGLNHEYFPKRGHRICWNQKGKHLACSEGLLTLDAQILAEDLATAIGKYKAKLD
jgi:hypothetical protein